MDLILLTHVIYYRLKKEMAQQCFHSVLLVTELLSFSITSISFFHAKVFWLLDPTFQISELYARTTFGLLDILTYLVYILLVACRKLLLRLHPRREIDHAKANNTGAACVTTHLIVMKHQILFGELNTLNLAALKQMHGQLTGC